jgi:hypothetical protein
MFTLAIWNMSTPAVYVGREQVFFKKELEAVGHGLPHAEGPYAGGSPTVLNAADQFALQQHGVGYGAEKDGQDYSDLQTTQQEKDEETHGVFRFLAPQGLKILKSVPQRLMSLREKPTL